ncbi:MAG: DNA-directed RNA polymerase [bacterium]
MRLLDDSIFAEERKAERAAVDGGVARYRLLAKRATDRGDGASLKPVERLMLYWHTRLTAAISKERTSWRRGTPGPNRQQYGPYLDDLRPAEWAVIALHETLSRCMIYPHGARLYLICLDIGRAAAAEIVIRTLRRKNHEAFASVKRRLKHRSHPKLVTQIARKITDGVWTLPIQVKVGAALFELVQASCYLPLEDGTPTPVFVKGMRSLNTHFGCRGRRALIISLAPEALKVIEEGHLQRQFLHPRYQPMLVQPMMWSKGQSGGYVELPMTAIKRAALTGAPEPPPLVYDGINALNRCPWRVNRTILPVVKELWEAGGNVAGVIRRNPYPIRPMTPEENADLDKRRFWREYAHKVHKRNENELPAMQNVFLCTLGVAEHWAERSKFWLPHQLDFRGRAYPVPLFLHHQGDDICRGLLEFADPVPITETGLKWIAVHLANCCGFDKIPFAQRIEWVSDNRAMFEKWIAAPLEHREWMDMDEPFQALAATHALLDEGAAAHLPVQADGSNNALQHYGAMLRCSETGGLVNLVPRETPSDIYAVVQLRVVESISAEARQGNRYAAAAEPWITRKLVKQPTMTDLYGVTMIGRRTQVEDQLTRAGYTAEDIYEVSKNLANAIAEASREVCAAAHVGMAWLKDCAQKIVLTGKRIEWTSPCGLRVVQPYMCSREMGVHTLRHLLWARTDDERLINITRQRNGFAPNFVHSVDAAHMLTTGIRTRAEGMDFAGVHDSYWCHAAHRDRMNVLLREEFIVAHKTPLLETLHKDLCATYPEITFAPPPKLGTLDLEAVRGSRYFFA